jgi:hypothetical protein
MLVHPRNATRDSKRQLAALKLRPNAMLLARSPDTGCCSGEADVRWQANPQTRSHPAILGRRGRWHTLWRCAFSAILARIHAAANAWASCNQNMGSMSAAVDLLQGAILNSRFRAASTASMVYNFAAGLPVSMREIVSWRTPARPARWCNGPPGRHGG